MLLAGEREVGGRRGRARIRKMMGKWNAHMQKEDNVIFFSQQTDRRFSPIVIRRALSPYQPPKLNIT